MMNINFDLPYEGYLWMSNKNHPCVYCPEALIDRGLFDGHNPFVAEGYLFNHEKGISISIKYVNGRYHIYIDTSTARTRTVCAISPSAWTIRMPCGLSSSVTGRRLPTPPVLT